MSHSESLQACEKIAPSKSGIKHLGVPIWGMTAPPVIRSFLLAHDLTGKPVVPFVTHGGYGLGNSIGVVEAHAPEATVRRGFSLEADQEKRTLETVSAWLDALPPTD
ncbi:flavodoxin family protein [Rhizobium leguminosarum]|uniref:flavodoxin family protein n=1 Tax=Rhizobium leguminosarum TaxID=384 RepID=UPI0024848D35|nr:flavodoxin [Rhizobium leguminosarum]